MYVQVNDIFFFVSYLNHFKFAAARLIILTAESLKFKSYLYISISVCLFVSGFTTGTFLKKKPSK